MTRFSFYDHDATQAECAHRLLFTLTAAKTLQSNFCNTKEFEDEAKCQYKRFVRFIIKFSAM